MEIERKTARDYRVSFHAILNAGEELDLYAWI
jgi:hypothetical protein